jgi:hypothetical protein
MKVTKDNAPMIFAEAQAEAGIATDKYMRETGEHPFNCGFAWVTIKPARGPLVTYMKSIGAARAAYGGGVQVWNPAGSMTQDMSAKYAGAKAFADVLKRYGVNCCPGSRLD